MLRHVLTKVNRLSSLRGVAQALDQAHRVEIVPAGLYRQRPTVKNLLAKENVETESDRVAAAGLTRGLLALGQVIAEERQQVTLRGGHDPSAVRDA